MRRLATTGILAFLFPSSRAKKLGPNRGIAPGKLTVKPKIYLVITGLTIAAVFVACAPTTGRLQTHQHQSIFNGRAVMEDEALARTVVAIHSVFPGAEEGTICSGTLISDSLVLTAAHCLVHKTMVRTILFGPNARHALHKRSVSREIVHPHWPAIERIHMMPSAERTEEEEMIYLGSSWNDIALLQFEGGIPKGFVASKILEDASLVQGFTKLIAAGYGISDREKMKGTGVLYTTELIVENPQFRPNEFTVDQIESGTCDGDSGGPLFLQYEKELLLVGVTSHGINDDHCVGRAVFSFLPKHIEWLKTQIKELAHVTK